MQYILGDSNGWSQRSDSNRRIRLHDTGELPSLTLPFRRNLTGVAETDIECYELVDSEVLNSGYEYVYLKVVGDSMEPLILEGDLVLVRLQEIVESGDYAVVIVDEEDGVVKQIEFDNDCIKLISQNPYYPPRIFKGKSRERVRIYGKVVESKRKFN